MVTGRETLHEINRAVHSARSGAGKLEKLLSDISDRLTANQLERGRTLKALAELRVAQIKSREMASSFDHAENAVLQALDERQQAMAQLSEQASALHAQLEALEAQREAQHDEVEAASLILAECEADAQQALEEESGYQAQLERARAAESIAQQAEEKTRHAAADRDEKGAPYLAEPLFRYLWDRHFGTSDYKGRGLARLLDGWVARLCGYADARPNYWTLSELPKRLAEHSTAVRVQAAAEIGELSKWEVAASAAAGVPDAQVDLNSAEDAQDQVDDQIDRVEQQLRANTDAHSRYALGQDEYSNRATEIIAEVYSRMKIDQLGDVAVATITHEDDELVMRLRDLRAEQKDLSRALEEQQRSRQRYIDQLKELEDVRRRFKRHRYDDLRSGFRNETLIQGVLREFLRGAISGGSVWDTIKREQRYQDVGGAWPDFGSGGFGRGGNQSPWHWPGGRGGFRMPSSGGSRSRGGFRTGGGF